MMYDMGDQGDVYTETRYNWRDGGNYRVEVEKMGGGTLNKAYDGTWKYQITFSDAVVFEGEDLFTGTPHTHAEAAELAWDFFVDSEYSED